MRFRVLKKANHDVQKMWIIISRTASAVGAVFLRAARHKLRETTLGLMNIRLILLLDLFALL